MQTHVGNITTKFQWIIPILLGVSVSTIKTEGKETGGTVRAIHILLIFTIGISLKL